MNKKIEGKNIIDFYIKVLTPVHIGAAKEKDLFKGVDYVSENGSIYFLDEKKILKDFKLHQYTNSLSKGDLKGLLRNKKLSDYSSKIIDNVAGEIGTDIKTHIKNTLDNKPYIPGTSLKGAIRSVILNIVKPIEISMYDRRTNREIIKEIEPFGKTQEDPFHYLIIGDSFFDESRFINSKTFNLFQENGNWEGGWKHKRGNSIDFNPNGFTFPYEIIPPDSIAKSRIIINEKAYKQAEIKHKVKKVDFLASLRLEDYQSILFSGIKSYTKIYIEKEIAFFKKYSNQETEIIIKEYERLLELNKKAPVLRIGQGSGFYSITGDHKFNDHLESINNPRRKYKSRKFAFKKNGDNYSFFPMGFVQLLLPNQIQNELENIEKRKKIRQVEAKKEKIKMEKEAAEAKKAAEEKAKKERIAAEEAQKPQFKNYKNLNPKKRYEMEAVVTGSGYPNKVDVFVKEGQIDKNIRLDVFRSPLDVGKVIIVEVAINKKGKVTQASFKNFKKTS